MNAPYASNKSDHDLDAAGSICPEIGVMLYDDPNACTSGWASVGGSAATYVRQHSDLANNVIWITNGSFSQYVTMGLRNVHNIRPITFFRTQINQIGTDLGYDMSGANAATVAPLISEIASRVFRLASTSYEWKPGELSNADSLFENIKSRFPKDVSLGNPALDRALHAAYQSDSALSKADFVPNSVFLTLRINRLTHAQKVLTCPIPDDGWEYIPLQRLPATSKERLAFCLQHDRPILAKVEIDMARADSDYASLAAFGQKASARMALREWVSHPELLWLVRFAPVEIKEVFRSHHYKALPEKMRLPRQLIEDPLLQLSYSAGLLAENHWMSLACEEYIKLKKQKMLSSRAVWLRAADRALCFTLAKKAVDAGFTVTGFGTGAIRVRVQRSELLKTLEFCIEHSLVCPNMQRLIQEDDLEYAA